MSRLPRQKQRRPSDPVRRQASADIYGGTKSATPATQIESEVLKVSRLPRQKQRRPSDPVCRRASADIYDACHANRARGAESVTSVTSKAAASADMYGGTKSATPATQIEHKVLKVSRLPRQKQLRPSDPVRCQLLRTSMKVLKVPRLPRKSSRRC